MKSQKIKDQFKFSASGVDISETPQCVKAFAQKGVNVAVLANETNAIVKEHNIRSPFPIVGLPMAVIGGKAIRYAKDTTGTSELTKANTQVFENGEMTTNEFSKKQQELILTMDYPQEVLDEQKMVDSYVRNAAEEQGLGYVDSLYYRSARDSNEDEQGKDDATAGAGIGESYPENFTPEDGELAMKKVHASAYTFQACGAFKGVKTDTGEPELEGGNMCVVVMPQIYSTVYGSALVFGDITGQFINIKFSPKKMGESLVAGNGEGVQEFKVSVDLLRKYIASGYTGGDPIIGKSHKLDNIMYQVVIALAHFAMVLQDKYGFVIDTEMAIGTLTKQLGAQIYIACVQFREHTAIQALRRKTTLELHEVKELPKEEPVITGTSVGNLCVVGEVHHIHSEEQLRTAPTEGKIFVMDEPYPSATGLISSPLRGIITKGVEFAHLCLCIDGIKPGLANMMAKKLIENGETVTILDNRVYIGDHSDKFEVHHIDLSKLKKLNKTLAGLVFGKPSQINKVYMLFVLDLISEISLARLEELIWDAFLPSLLDWAYVENIDRSTEKGRNAYNIIRHYMEVHSTTDSKVAFAKTVAGHAAPLVALCQQFGKMFNLRTYGGRLDEDPNNLVGILPAEITPCEKDGKLLGYNGYAMYCEEWGEVALDMSLMVVAQLKEWGYDNVSVFIPNVSTPLHFERLVINKMQYYGVEDHELHIMNETGTVSWYFNEDYVNTETGVTAPSFKKLGVVKHSWGFNDKRHIGGGYHRVYQFKDGRDDLNSSMMQRMIEIENAEAKKADMKTGSCGLASMGAIKAMVRSGAEVVGIPFGKKFLDGYNLLYKLEEELIEELLEA